MNQDEYHEKLLNEKERIRNNLRKNNRHMPADKIDYMAKTNLAKPEKDGWE